MLMVTRPTANVVAADYGDDHSELYAVLKAEQRDLVKQVGHGSAPGLTYMAKADERRRRGPASLV